MNITQIPIRIMIDMEGTAQCASSGILTLGACTFGLPFGQQRQKFYERASLASNESMGRTISRSTMEWWDKQDKAMRDEAFGGTQNINLMLIAFEQWCIEKFAIDAGREALVDRIELWSRGAGFDCEILQDAFLNIFGYYPFDFRKHMCQRTVERLMPASLKSAIPPQQSKHHALEDAMYQANVMDVALKNMMWFGTQDTKN
jgi:hypothetical protein